MNASSDRPASELRAGDYELLWPLATGGMGQVFLARKTAQGLFEKRVALKLLLPHLSSQPQFVQMFLNEARIAARMNHPNVVSIFDLGVADGRYYLAMALVEGVSLRSLLDACKQTGKHLPLPLVRLIASGLCEGLHYAHTLRGTDGAELCVVHRDVNPSNVMISVAGAVQLTDFGIARAAGSTHHTATGEVRGKVAYLAPEQVTEEFPVDRRADIFAAGVTLYQTLTLVSPFLRSTDAATLHAIQNAVATDCRELRPDADPHMAAALLHALAARPSDRPESAQALLTELLDGPIGSPAELGEWVTRLCAPELNQLHEAPPTTAPPTDTHLLPSRTTIADLPRQPLLRRWMKWGAALTVLGGLIALVVTQTERPQPAPAAVNSEAAPAATELEPPPTRAKPDPTPAPVSEASLPPAEPGPPRKVPRVKKPRAPAAVAPLKLGYLTADATPWAELLLDGKVVENTPISQYPVPVGEHRLVFRQRSTGREVHRQIVVREGEVVMVRVRFDP